MYENIRVPLPLPPPQKTPPKIAQPKIDGLDPGGGGGRLGVLDNVRFDLNRHSRHRRETSHGRDLFIRVDV